MRLYKDGITRNTENPNVIADLKKAGYVEVTEPLKENPTEKKVAKSTKEGE